MSRLVHITTVPESLAFLSGQVGYLKRRGWDVAAISSPGTLLDEFSAAEGIPAHPLPMQRRITPLRDLAALVSLWRLLRRMKPDVVHAHTPKAGLLGMIAAWLSRVPLRIYHVHGLPLMTASGWRKHLLTASERVACRLSHQVLCVSPSIGRVAAGERIVAAAKLRVFGSGSINGVDAQGRFDPARGGGSTKRETRRRMSIPENALVVGFVGRIVRDKGLHELAAAWHALRADFPSLHLLIVGPFESQDPVSAEVRQLLQSDPRIHLAGPVPDTAPYYAAMDVLAFPSHREGFGCVAIEAAAMSLPVVATSIPGCVDAVRDGVTGTLVPPRDAAALAEAIGGYLRDPDLGRRHGRAGRERALAEFRPEAIWQATHENYLDQLARRRAVRPLRRIGSATAGSDTGSQREPLANTLGIAEYALTIASEEPELPRRQTWARRVKRCLDVVVAAALLAVLWPVMLATWLAVCGTMGRPALFRQRRPGLGAQPFDLYKFRTMNQRQGPDGELLPDAQRLTRLGRLLRGTSLDELPQLWNVLRGEMSLVGPRPLLTQYLDRYTPRQRRRHEVRPGITGWAQVNGRNAIGWDQKFELDVWYVDHWSLRLDLKILALTAWRVLRRHGVSSGKHATMPEFLGTARRAREAA